MAKQQVDRTESISKTDTASGRNSVLSDELPILPEEPATKRTMFPSQSGAVKRMLSTEELRNGDEADSTTYTLVEAMKDSGNCNNGKAEVGNSSQKPCVLKSEMGPLNCSTDDFRFDVIDLADLNRYISEDHGQLIDGKMSREQ